MIAGCFKAERVKHVPHTDIIYNMCLLIENMTISLELSKKYVASLVGGLNN